MTCTCMTCTMTRVTVGRESLKGPGGLVLAGGKRVMNTMTYITRLRSLRPSNPQAYLNENPTTPRTGLGKIRKSCPMGAGLRLNPPHGPAYLGLS